MKINQYIDHTNIRKESKKEDIIKTCNEAKQYNFRGVCIRPQWVKLVSKELKGIPHLFFSSVTGKNIQLLKDKIWEILNS